ncbi:TonB-dependent receptor [Novosphingobium resinovorum]|nr:TonB-dependent receptor [Novosphingobium resinovorum]
MAALAGATSIAAMAATPAMAQQRQFAIEAGDLKGALDAFARQTGRPVIYRSEDVKGVRSPGFRGTASAETALSAILARSGFAPRFDSSGAVAIVRTPAPQARKSPAAARPVEQVAVPAADDVPAEAEPAIVVTGIRSSLERAADVKRNAVQVVDSIVAEDIGKLPDPTTAAALQRVPGIQVETDRNNELTNVRIRGLTDIGRTLNGREMFTTTSRDFDVKDVPAQALSRIDVFKSQTADLIEGGVAGAIDLKLNQPFNFKKPTFVVTARENYASRLGKAGPQVGGLATTRFDTGIGEIGVLVNGSFSKSDSERSQTNMTDRRSSGVSPLNTPGYLIPQVIQNMPNVGAVTRGEANAAVQWQASPSLQVYAEGLYTYFRTTTGFSGFNPQPFNAGTSITDIVASDNCFQTRVNASGTNPTLVNNADGTQSLQPYTVQTLCDIKSATLKNVVINQNSSSDRLTQTNRMVAGGLKFDRDRARATLDVSYQKSRSFDENVNIEVGQRVDTVYLTTDNDGAAAISLDPSIPTSSANLSLRNAFNQNFTLATGSLFQARFDGERDLGGIFSKIQAGIRFADRKAVYRNVQQTNPTSSIGCNNIETGKASCLVSDLGLSSDFIGTIGYAPGINGGSNFVGASPDYLLSERGRNELRSLFGLALRQPDYDPTHQFDASERTWAGYVQAAYAIDLGGDLALDGVVGVRGVNTDRTIATYRKDSTGAIVPISETRSDFDLLPSATARLQWPGGFQMRLDYSRTMRRPDFGSLNPTQSLTYVGNVFLLNTATAGNPDLKPQKSDSFDATAEYYFHSGSISLDGFYRTIRNRVVSSAVQTTIDGTAFLLTTPRNVGEVTLKGIESSAQYFFDFLPGAFSGIGVQAAFTYIDSRIGGSDPLAGRPLQGVSKYNYTLGALYEKSGISGRLIYTFRSRYYSGDNSGAVSLRPIDSSRIDDVFIPTQLIYVRPAGRLDFSIGVDVNPAFHIDIGGTNITRTRTRQYFGVSYLNAQVYGDETTYSIGVRVRL